MITMFWPQKYLRCLDVTTLITCERENEESMVQMVNWR